jgi:hypothetical protein
MNGSNCCRTTVYERQGARLENDMTNDRFKPDLEELRTRFDAYGADMTRWPQAARARAEAAVSVDPQVARMLAESKALDAVLAHAPLPAPERRAALADRIVAEARSLAVEAASHTPARQPGTVIPWPGARRAPPGPAVSSAQQTPWRAVALLAASLMLGVFVGAYDLVPGAIDPLVDAVDFSSDFDQTAAVVSDGLAASLDEDFL